MPTTYAIPDGRTAFNVLLWSGTGGSSGATRSITGLNFKPDLVWEKSRTSGSGHQWMDSVRGAGTGKVLASNSTGAEPTPAASPESSYGWLSSFDTGGFTTTNGTSTWDNYNKSGDTYVAWNWLAGGTAATNNAGSITSTVSANTTAGFSVVTYTGTGANATVGHGLNATPAMIMVKNRDSGAIGGAVYHTSMGATKYLKLFQTTTGSDQEATDNTAWNGGSPTFNSSVFSVGSLNRTNSSQQMVAYCFAPVAGYSAFGSYTGNGLPDGPFVYLGFRPRWVMFKKTSATSNWSILDTSRDNFNVADNPLLPNTSGTESTSTSTSGAFADILSNGFKLRGNSGDINDGSATYIYAAFAENPFKYANAR
jgi:hypothetical protein